MSYELVRGQVQTYDMRDTGLYQVIPARERRAEGYKYIGIYIPVGGDRVIVVEM
jgi:hypothetical protein